LLISFRHMSCVFFGPLLDKAVFASSSYKRSYQRSFILLLS